VQFSVAIENGHVSFKARAAPGPAPVET
jgi:hypothetical protein